MLFAKYLYNWPLMYNNITKSDITALKKFLSQSPLPVLTNSKMVLEFEKQWSEWLGVKYSVFVNSGSSANLITMSLLKHLLGSGEVILPPLTWVSDVASVLQSGLTPKFCDINLSNLAIDENLFEKSITFNTKVLFLTHILGYNGLTDKIVQLCEKNKIILVEDACESHGATYKNQKVGSVGLISNFSFYYAHHMSSIEGGMICTNEKSIYNLVRMFRSHGLLREHSDANYKLEKTTCNPDLNPEFIFMFPAYNMRSTEINAVIAINQLKNLDKNNKLRKRNLDIFLDNLNSNIYFTEFNREGNSNYALTLLLKNENFELRNKIEALLKNNIVEFRRGMSGGGNQLRQPFMKKMFPGEYNNYPVCDHVHHFGWYIGNFPSLHKEKILKLTKLLNSV
jgi:CDP-6-deoxy-D-xylo-4-hexulose-3-dehydrase